MYIYIFVTESKKKSKKSQISLDETKQENLDEQTRLYIIRKVINVLPSFLISSPITVDIDDDIPISISMVNTNFQVKCLIFLWGI